MFDMMSVGDRELRRIQLNRVVELDRNSGSVENAKEKLALLDALEAVQAELEAARALRNTLEGFPWAIPNAMNQVGQDEWFRLNSELTKAIDAYDAARAPESE